MSPRFKTTCFIIHGISIIFRGFSHGFPMAFPIHLEAPALRKAKKAVQESLAREGVPVRGGAWGLWLGKSPIAMMTMVITININIHGYIIIVMDIMENIYGFWYLWIIYYYWILWILLIVIDDVYYNNQI